MTGFYLSGVNQRPINGQETEVNGFNGLEDESYLCNVKR